MKDFSDSIKYIGVDDTDIDLFRTVRGACGHGLQLLCN